MADDAPRPLADRLRPQSLEEIVGQDHLLQGEGALARMVAGGAFASLVLWGPPGCGKTTIARLLARMILARALSPITSTAWTFRSSDA